MQGCDVGKVYGPPLANQEQGIDLYCFFQDRECSYWQTTYLSLA